MRGKDGKKEAFVFLRAHLINIVHRLAVERTTPFDFTRIPASGRRAPNKLWAIQSLQALSFFVVCRWTCEVCNVWHRDLLSEHRSALLRVKYHRVLPNVLSSLTPLFVHTKHILHFWRRSSSVADSKEDEISASFLRMSHTNHFLLL